MANTYTQLYFHVVFAVRGRQNHIDQKWKEDLYKYIAGIIASKNQKLLIVNGMPNHIHLLLGTQPNCNLSDLVRDIKANSSRWVNEKGYAGAKFEWQLGFGAFTISQSQLSKVIDYVKNQEKHHRVKSFKEEYIGFLKAHDIEYNDEYTFDDD